MHNHREEVELIYRCRENDRKQPLDLKSFNSSQFPVFIDAKMLKNVFGLKLQRKVTAQTLCIHSVVHSKGISWSYQWSINFVSDVLAKIFLDFSSDFFYQNKRHCWDLKETLGLLWSLFFFLGRQGISILYLISWRTINNKKVSFSFLFSFSYIYPFSVLFLIFFKSKSGSFFCFV